MGRKADSALGLSRALRQPFRGENSNICLGRMCLFLDYNVENYDLKAPTGILLGATDQEFASSSLRLTCTCSCMIRVRKLEEDFEEGEDRAEEDEADLIQKLAMACFDLQASQPELYLVMTKMGMVTMMVIYINRKISYGPNGRMDGWRR